MRGWKVRPGAGGPGRRHDDDDGHQRAARHRDRAHQAEPPTGEEEAETSAATRPVATTRTTALVLNIIWSQIISASGFNVWQCQVV